MRVYVASLTAAAIAAGGALAFFDRRHTPASWLLSAGFLALLTAAEYFMVRFNYRNQVMGITLFGAMLAPLVYSFPGLAVVALVGIAQVFSALLHKDSPVKATFNVSQWVLASAGGSGAFSLLRQGEALTPRNVGALVTAMTVVAILNTVLITTVIRLAQGRSVRHVFGTLVPAIVVGWAFNTPIGLLFIVSFHAQHAAIVLFVVPLAMLWVAHRSYAAVVADKTRLSGLHKATRVLAGPMDPRDAIPGFLSEIRASFGAETVELVLLANGGRHVHRVTEEGEDERLETEDVVTLASMLATHGRPARVTPDVPFGDQLEREGWRSCVAAPVEVNGQVVAVLCAYNATGPEGFEEGEVTVLQALAREVAAAMQKGALLADILEERRKLSEIIEQASDGIVTVGPDGSVLTWNPELERITGYPTSEMVGARGLDRLRPRDEEGHDVFIERWALGAIDLPRMVQIRTREGELRWISCSTSRVTDAEGKPRVMIIVARDVTKAREVEQLKDDFVATVSHELRTPLTPIKGWAETLVRSGELMSAEDRKHASASILTQAQHLERLITNLLEVSQIERTSGKLRESHVDVREVAEKVWKTFRIAHPERRLMLEVSDEARALGDEVFVEQILTNLMTNAIKYTPEAEPISISVGARSGVIEVSVRDNGPGIPQGEQERIFERFHRLGDVMTRTVGGTGLGLYIARQLAKAMDATLELSSTLGEGSTFTLRLRGAGKLASVTKLAAG